MSGTLSNGSTGSAGSTGQPNADQTASISVARPEKTDLRLGFVRLTDSAPLIIAQELGYFAEFGLDVELEAQSSWANIRDKVAVGHLDAAQMLAPMLFTTTLGLGGMRTPLLTGLSLSANGNAITLSNELAAEIVTPESSFTTTESARATSQRLNALLHDQSTPTRAGFTLATVHPFSTHSILLRMWLHAGGIDPDKDVRMVVLPPEQMVDSLSRGIIDGFCVGEPWNSRAVQYGIGSMVATGYQIWNNAPEKVLGVTQTWHATHPASHLRLRLALMKSSQWLDAAEHREDAARILSKANYLGISESELLPSLTGNIRFSRDQEAVQISCFHKFFDRSTGFPWRSHGDLIFQQIEQQVGREFGTDKRQALIQECYRPDLYREAARELEIPSPNQDRKDENTHSKPWLSDQGLEMGADLFLD